jgi:LysM repeat protein
MNYPQLWRSSALALPLLLAVLAAPVQASGHTVRSGETLTSIARKHQVSLTAMQKANPGINPGKIVQGQVLRLPGHSKTPVVADSAKPASKKSVVAKTAKPGGPPSAKNKTPVSPPTPAVRRPVAEADRLTAAPAPQRRSTKGITTHRVRQGETLVGLARRHGVSVADLVEMNGLDSPDLMENQKLILPALSSAPVPAPSRSAVMDQENTVDLTPPPRRGQEEAKPARRSAPPVNPPAPQGTYYHVVKNGETLTSIARDRGVTVAALSEANRSVDPRRLAVNQRLNIPGVQLASRQSDTDMIDEGAPAPVTSYRFSTGEEAGIPESPETNTFGDPLAEGAEFSRLSYRVSERDSMDSIAREFGTTPRALRQLNQMGPFDRLTAGSFISVPWQLVASAE